ncbi:hypothetical protein Nepgr_007804 [Nepenthes gracilis]|uniref:Uncharacterized protein n=1 Tax=Nepenthes gracilis TaxID=150966 RepID=A0AAD3S7Y2_NEPGR|nr:hypothetical protein Nepgr_007804 [Nepenthes gracilis]
MEGNVDQLSQVGQALPTPGVPTRSLKEGTSEEISSVASRVEGSSDLPELIADRDSDQSPCHQVTNSDDQIDRFPDEAPSVKACNSSGVALNLAAAEGSVLDIFDSVNSFTILQEPEDLDVQELQCGPPIELSCKAPVSIPGAAPGNKPVELTSKAEMHADLEPRDDVQAVSSADDAGKNWATDSDPDDDSSQGVRKWSTEDVFFFFDRRETASMDLADHIRITRDKSPPKRYMPRVNPPPADSKVS